MTTTPCAECAKLQRRPGELIPDFQQRTRDHHGFHLYIESKTTNPELWRTAR